MNSCYFHLSVFIHSSHSFSMIEHKLVLKIVVKYYCFIYEELYRAWQGKLNLILKKELAFLQREGRQVGVGNPLHFAICLFCRKAWVLKLHQTRVR